MNATPHRPAILLTGATGCIGGRLLALLEARGHRIRCLTRRPAALDRARGTAHRRRARRLPRPGVAAGCIRGDRHRLLFRPLDGRRGRLRNAGPRRGAQLRGGGAGRRRAPYRVHGRARRFRRPLAAPAEPTRDRRGAARVRRARHRVPQRRRARGRQPVVRADPGPGRAASGDDLPLVGRHADATDRAR